MLLIFPPLAKACEPPAGITRLAGFLRGNNQHCSIWDANLESQLYLLEQLEQKQDPEDTWSKRALKNIGQNLQALRTPGLYENSDRYQRVTRDINRALSRSSTDSAITISLADYQDHQLSPHNSNDLLQAAREYEDSCFFPLLQNRLPQLLAGQHEKWIGISLNYLSQALPTFALAGFLKARYPACKIILGGGLITSWMRDPAWTNPFTELFDFCIAGPGEEPLLDILDSHAAHTYFPPDFTGLPLPEYLAPGFILPYNASTGCYWNRCSFCPEKAEGGPYLKIPDNRVMEDLQKLTKTFKPRLIHFLDNAVAPSLMKEIIQRPINTNWYGFARVSDELSNPEFCKALRNSGCVMLKLGIESGSQQVLDAMDKGINLRQVEKSLTALHDAGIATYVYLLFGTPAESSKEAGQTLDFTVRNSRCIDFLNLAIFNLPRNSAERHALDIHPFSHGDLGLYSDFCHPKGWDRKAVRNFLHSDFKSHPRIRPILQRDPPFFTSNHAPFMAVSDRHRKGHIS